MATYTIDQYNALVAALASGAKFVKYSDKEVEYRSIGEMQSLKREMEIDLGILRPASRRKVTQYNSGLDDWRRVRPGGGRAPAVVVLPTPSEVTITIFVKASPDHGVLTYGGNGVTIYQQYAPCNILIPVIYSSLLSFAASAPLMAGKPVVMPVFVNNEVNMLVPYNMTLGGLDNTAAAAPGGYGWNDGDVVIVRFIK